MYEVGALVGQGAPAVRARSGPPAWLWRLRFDRGARPPRMRPVRPARSPPCGDHRGWAQGGDTTRWPRGAGYPHVWCGPQPPVAAPRRQRRRAPRPATAGPRVGQRMPRPVPERGDAAGPSQQKHRYHAQRDASAHRDQDTPHGKQAHRERRAQCPAQTRHVRAQRNRDDQRNQDGGGQHRYPVEVVGCSAPGMPCAPSNSSRTCSSPGPSSATKRASTSSRRP